MYRPKFRRNGIHLLWKELRCSRLKSIDCLLFYMKGAKKSNWEKEMSKVKFKSLMDFNADPICMLFNEKSNKFWLLTSAHWANNLSKLMFFPSRFFNNEILILEIRLSNHKKPLSASTSLAKSMTYWIWKIFIYSNLFDIWF